MTSASKLLKYLLLKMLQPPIGMYFIQLLFNEELLDIRISSEVDYGSLLFSLVSFFAAGHNNNFALQEYLLKRHHNQM